MKRIWIAGVFFVVAAGAILLSFLAIYTYDLKYSLGDADWEMERAVAIEALQRFWPRMTPRNGNNTSYSQQQQFESTKETEMVSTSNNANPTYSV